MSKEIGALTVDELIPILFALCNAAMRLEYVGVNHLFCCASEIVHILDSSDMAKELLRNFYQAMAEKGNPHRSVTKGNNE